MYSILVEKSLEYVSRSLGDMKSKGYHFHNFGHTIEVFERTTYLSQKESMNDELTELLQIASIFHDTGFLHQYDNNETLGSQIVENYLTSQEWFFEDRKNFSEIIDSYLIEFDYESDKIQIIKNLIHATMPFVKPRNILEKIIKDSDIDNFGRNDFFDKGVLLRKELSEVKNIEFTELQWLKYVNDLFQELHFYTKTQIKERQSIYLKNKQTVESRYQQLLKETKSI